MILDGHIHILNGTDDRAVFRSKLRAAGIDGGIVMSLPPPSFPQLASRTPAPIRLSGVLDWCRGDANLYPFFWIDPLEPKAMHQVTAAVRSGIRGFKVISDRFDPGDPRAMKIYRAIAATGRPILFHSGILWDGKPSSTHTRPLNFEALMDVDGLRFALAHIGWPWCEELIAVYGKLLNAYSLRRDQAAEMFIDLTPGTPPIRREEALTLLFKIGYDVASNVFFGADCRAGDYQGQWVQDWIRRDNRIYRKLGLQAKILQSIYSDNLLRFIRGGVTTPRHLPRPDAGSGVPRKRRGAVSR
jgi:predicted TIM-barrel fold metal-dependent hydrolase